jgi:hypothetical protein
VTIIVGAWVSFDYGVRRIASPGQRKFTSGITMSSQPVVTEARPTSISAGQPESVDYCCERSRLLLAVRIVKEEAGERRCPILHHSDQRSVADV